MVGAVRFERTKSPAPKAGAITKLRYAPMPIWQGMMELNHRDDVQSVTVCH